MAVLGISQPQARPQKSRELSDLDKLFKGLQIANAGMGIAVNFQKLNEDRDGLIAAQTEKAEVGTEKIRSDIKLDREKFDFKKTQDDNALILAASEKVEAGKEKQSQAILGFQQDFRKSPGFQVPNAQIKESNVLIDLMKKSVVTNLDVQIAIRKAIRASGDTRIAVDDVRAMTPNTAWIDKFFRMTDEKLRGQPLQDDIDVIRELGVNLGKFGRRDMAAHAKRFSATEGQILDMPIEQILSDVLRQDLFPESTDPTPEGSTQTTPVPIGAPREVTAAPLSTAGRDPTQVQGQKPPAPFSDDDINAVMKGLKIDRNQAIINLMISKQNLGGE